MGNLNIGIFNNNWKYYNILKKMGNLNIGIFNNNWKHNINFHGEGGGNFSNKVIILETL
jgi:hypothetical protein